MRHLRLAPTIMLFAALPVGLLAAPCGAMALPAGAGRAGLPVYALASGTPTGPDRARTLLIADQKPLGAVLRAIGKRYPGRALDARQTERDGRPLYQIKWLGNDGKVRDITADARTGEILRVR